MAPARLVVPRRPREEFKAKPPQWLRLPPLFVVFFVRKGHRRCITDAHSHHLSFVVPGLRDMDLTPQQTFHISCMAVVESLNIGWMHRPDNDILRHEAFPVRCAVCLLTLPHTPTRSIARLGAKSCALRHTPTGLQAPLRKRNSANISKHSGGGNLAIGSPVQIEARRPGRRCPNMQ